MLEKININLARVGEAYGNQAEAAKQSGEPYRKASFSLL